MSRLRCYASRPLLLQRLFRQARLRRLDIEIEIGPLDGDEAIITHAHRLGHVKLWNRTRLCGALLAENLAAVTAVMSSHEEGEAGLALVTVGSLCI